MDIEGRTALVTGSNRGLGRHLARQLRDHGAVVYAGARDPESVDLDGVTPLALDVTDPEPLPDGHPLWKCPNLLLTPHIGGSSPQFAARAVRVASEELHRYMAGEPLQNVVQAAI